MKAKTNEYLKLRDKADALTNKLGKMHRSHMECKMGCDLCCMDYSIFPVEFYSIAKQLEKQEITSELPSVNNNNTCVFLKDHKCTIYSERPIICRTHGLPLLYVNEGEEWELSACELNFTDFDFMDFTNENTFPQDIFNSELFMLNRKFVHEFEEKKYNEFDLTPIRNLLEYVSKTKNSCNNE